ncbi:MAG: hypothetical protein EHM58_06470 [Ignavibacteriae bacterium]|nr:MAG: hypothetical protein EHM58_06470 [Ignavibacteriota bacterium]
MLKKNVKATQADVFGPFIRAGKDDKWHWEKRCSHYPQIDNPEVRFCSYSPDMEELCEECMNLQEKE